MRQLLWILCGVITALSIMSPVLDPDLWWHIAIGRWILANGAVPYHEYWNAYAFGHPFRAYSWLQEVLFASIDARFGYEGLYWAKFVLAQVIVFSFFYVFSRLAGDWFFGMLLAMLASVSCQFHFTLRPQSFTWIFFIWTIFFVDKAKRDDSLFPAGLPVIFLMSLWANSHITTVLGLGAIFAWTVTKERYALGLWLLFFGFLGTALTPYWGAEWLTFLSKTGHPMAHSSISEFAPATVLQYTTGFLLFGAAMLALMYILQPTLMIPLRLIFAGCLVLGGLAVIKFLPYAAIYLFAVVAATWRDAALQGKPFGNFQEAVHRFRGLFERKWLPPEGLGFLLVCIVAVLFKQATAEKLHTAIVPKTAVDFIEEKKIPPPILGSFTYGGYLMRYFTDSEGRAEQKVIIDGRTNVTPEDIHEYMGAFERGKKGWRKLIELYQPNAILWHGDSPVVGLLLVSGEWCLVYSDEQSELKHAVLIRKSEYEARPNEFPNAECER